LIFTGLSLRFEAKAKRIENLESAGGLPAEAVFVGASIWPARSNRRAVNIFARLWKMFCQSPFIWGAALSKSKQTDLARLMQDARRTLGNRSAA